MTLLRFKTQARAICAAVAPWARASLSTIPPDFARSPAASGNQGMKPMFCLAPVIEHAFARAIYQVVAVLHRGDRENLARGLDVLDLHVA